MFICCYPFRFQRAVRLSLEGKQPCLDATTTLEEFSPCLQKDATFLSLEGKQPCLDAATTVEEFSPLIIMETCKAPTVRLKALNKHTHIKFIEN